MRFRFISTIAAILMLFGMAGGCLFGSGGRSGLRPPRGTRARQVLIETTGYCSCGECCGWKRNWIGRPVYAYGTLKGQRKKVGQTASGVQARAGTLAADTRLFPFGTVMFVPGYGYGRVEDRGGDIKGKRLDLYFHSHKQALEWGRKTLEVTVYERH